MLNFVSKLIRELRKNNSGNTSFRLADKTASCARRRRIGDHLANIFLGFDTLFRSCYITTMALKFVFLFAVLAMVGADEECGEEKVGVCIERLLSSLMEDLEEEQACVELRDVSKCLRDAADECLGENRDPEIDEGLQELDTLLEQNCPAVEEDDKHSKCAEENQDYLLDCISEAMSEVNTLLGQPAVLDMNSMKCSLYSLMSECIVERTGEKCGEEARKMAKEEMDDMPEEIKEACAAQDSINFFETQLLDRKK